MYKIDKLVNLFLCHAEKAQEQNERLLQQFIENNPGEPIPEHFTDNFSLPLALATICAEIVELKYQIKTDKDLLQDD